MARVWQALAAPPLNRSPRLTKSSINELLDRHDLAPSRALGQNFLSDPAMIDKIVRLAGVAPGDRVVEIGPGLGSLTVGLLDAGADVLAVEIDRYLIPALTEVVDQAAEVSDGNVRILHADAMTIDWSSELGDEPAKVVANLPYNVATPLVLDLLKTQPLLNSFLVMVQAEVGERLAAGPGSKKRGIPSVITEYWGHAAVVGRVPPQVFIPQPRVDSVLVRIVRDDTRKVDAPFGELSALVRAGFGQRRKMLRRSLSGLLDESSIADADVDPTARAETLDLESWGRLTRQYCARDDE